jgi:hypothetical protein
VQLVSPVVSVAAVWLGLPAAEITLPIEPFVSLGGVLISVIVTGCFGLLSIWLNKRLNTIDTKTGEGAGTVVRELDPEFKAKVTEALEAIQNTQATQGRDIGGLREENRTERQERILLAHVVSKLIEKE